MIGNGRVQEGLYMLEANPSKSTEFSSEALEAQVRKSGSFTVASQE